MKNTYPKHLCAVCLLAAVLFSAAVPLSAQSGDGGQPGAFLRNGVSSRALGMGGAFTALADDPSALYWNPAGLATLRFYELVGTYTALSLDRKYNFFALGIPIRNYGAVGVGFINFGVGGIEGRDLAGDITGALSNSENAFYISYAYEIQPGVCAGLSLKYLSHGLADYQSTGYGFDLGVRYAVSPKILVGLAIQDMSTRVSWNTESGLEETYPMVYRLGGALRPFNNNARFTLDYHMVQKQKGTIRAGIEYPVTPNFGLRAGYDGKGIVGGGYVAVPLNTMMFALDYSFGKDPMDLTFMHRVSLRLKFGGTKYDYIPAREAAPGRVNGEAGMLLAGFTARITKTLPENPNFALINAGQKTGITTGLMLEVYRNEKLPGDKEEQKVLIGEVQVAVVKTDNSAVKVEWMKQGYLLKVGDFLMEKK
ncbi:PorV/PorQ family protein [bacterium]|nr:PorV/PorQ family protein [bacterium]